MFLGIVTRVNLSTTSLSRTAGTIDCECPHMRFPLMNVRVLSPTYSSYREKEGDQFIQHQAGFTHLPSVGDYVVLEFLDDIQTNAVCLGSIFNIDRNKGVALVALDQANSLKPIPEHHQKQDALWKHESGSFIRMRNLEVTVNAEGESIVTGACRSEMLVQHRTGAKIAITELPDDKVEIEISHPLGASFKVSSDGTLTITSSVAANIVVNAAKQINVTASDNIALESSKEIHLTAADNVIFDGTKEFNITADEGIAITGSEEVTIKSGKGAGKLISLNPDSAVPGEELAFKSAVATLKGQLDTLAGVVKNHTHPYVDTPVGPSVTSPITPPPADPAVIDPVGTTDTVAG